ncbi:unnamed protein product [Absidia cylindrospora]
MFLGYQCAFSAYLVYRKLKLKLKYRLGLSGFEGHRWYETEETGIVHLEGAITPITIITILTEAPQWYSNTATKIIKDQLQDLTGAITNNPKNNNSRGSSASDYFVNLFDRGPNVPRDCVHQAEWDMDSLCIFDLVSPKPELILFGTGATFAPLPAHVRKHFYDMGVQVDIMNTKHAAATYNVLAEEGRRVAAALLPVGGGDAKVV